jgi:hypothetical protein
MRIKSQKDFFAGLMFSITGAAFAIGATNYTIGDGARMGPGYFPLMLGIVLTILGAIVVLQSMVIETESGDKIGTIAWKPLCYIIGANVLFGICLGGIPKVGIPSLGLIVGIYALTFVSALAGDEFNFKEVAVLATVLAILSFVAFVWLLNLQFPVWPTFVAG